MVQHLDKEVEADLGAGKIEVRSNEGIVEECVHPLICNEEMAVDDQQGLDLLNSLCTVIETLEKVEKKLGGIG